MDGFKRPAKVNVTASSALPTSPPRQVSPPLEEGVALIEDSVDHSAAPLGLTPKRPRKRWVLWLLITTCVVIAGVVVAYVWYLGQLQPVDSKDTTVQRVEIKAGSSFSFVADSLHKRGLIRSPLAFSVYASLQGKRDTIKAGTCNLTPSETPSEILHKITTGCYDFRSITFYPGATLEPSLYAQTKARVAGKEFKDPSIRASLLAAGYSNADITAAFAATYTGDIFTGKPTDQGLEGYVFGETYYVDTDATVKEALQTALDHMREIIQANDIATKFTAHGLTLYEGITLASIVEKELDCEGKPTEERKNRCYGYQQRIATVFYNRLHRGMSLGSDVTSIYASDKLGVTSSVEVDSPYNTRRYAGLPPGPIATPGKLALLAVANPATGDDLYFLAGDDGLLYFATDEAGHTANIKNHCQTLCGDL